MNPIRPHHPNLTRDFVPRIAASLLLIAITVALYWPVGHAKFINMDDPLYVQNNYHVTTGLTWRNVLWSFQAGYATNWHPLTWMSHMLDCELFGDKPGPMHMVNVGFHCANAVLLFLVFGRMTGKLWSSGLVALLFAIHPLHVQSVAWISERKDVLSTFFALLTLAAYVGYVRRRGGRKPALFYGMMLFLYACALMSKPMVVTLPFLLLLLDYWPLGRVCSSGEARDERSRPAIEWTRLIVEKVPMFVMSAFTCYMTTIAQKNAIADDIIPITQRLQNSIVCYISYLGKTIWPTDLAAYYPYAAIWKWWEVLACLVVLMVVSAIALYARKSKPYLLCGWLWFLGGLFPVIGIVQVGGAAMADRYSYLPLVGIFVAIVWWLDDTMTGWRGVTTKTAGAVVIASFAWCAFYEVGYWQNSAMLFSKTLSNTRSNYFAIKSMVIAYIEAGNYGLAIRDCQQALTLVSQSPEAVYLWGNALILQAKYEEALPYYYRAISEKHDFDEAYFNLANALSILGRYREAEENYQTALNCNPDLLEARINLATTLLLDGKPEDAIAQYKNVLEMDPANADAHFLLGSTLGKGRRWDEAIGHFREAVRLQPRDPGPMNDLAWILATTGTNQSGNQSEAISLAETACSLSAHTNAGYLDTLAVAYAKNGRFADATQWTEKARLLSQRDNPRLSALMEKRLHDYRMGKVSEFYPSVPQISAKQLLDSKLNRRFP